MCVYVIETESTHMEVCTCTADYLCLWGLEAEVVSSLIMFHLTYEATSLTETQRSLTALVKLAGLLRGSPSVFSIHSDYRVTVVTTLTQHFI